jgi:hypothetical protein
MLDVVELCDVDLLVAVHDMAMAASSTLRLHI